MEKIPDLNLLLHLDALVRCANVSRAAEHLGITQSAMSAALSRLRRVFNDPLLVREGNTAVLTERAMALAAQFQPLLEQWLDVTLERGQFDPLQSRRIFTLYASDYVQFALLPALASTLADDAPNIALSIVPAKPHHGLAMLESNHVEFVAGYYPTPGSTLRMRPLFEDQVVCIVREGHASLDKDWDLDAWLRYGHIDLAAQEPVSSFNRCDGGAGARSEMKGRPKSDPASWGEAAAQIAGHRRSGGRRLPTCRTCLAKRCYAPNMPRSAPVAPSPSTRFALAFLICSY